ncbi:MAG TPA: lysozyme [Bacteroidota bacterium]|nr:lysozyme [Bacteroidota bacterium]
MKAYLCPAGVWTIGYGHTGGVKEGDRITLQQAEELLKQDLERFEECIRRSVTVPLNQNQFDALVSFAFNVGCMALENSTLLRKLNAGDYAGAAQEFGKWVKSRGVILPGLIKRRDAERALFERA